jgi:Ca2+-binding RTX toxin-like protein
MRWLPLVAVLVALLAYAPGASANTSHAGWPQITGMLLMNKQDQTRPLDGRPGHDPFGGKDASYSCDGLHKYTDCIDGGPSFLSFLDDVRYQSCEDLPLKLVDACETTAAPVNVVPADIGHNELLGGHGDDTITAGDAGDVIWGDYKPSGQPTAQFDRLTGGAGRDFIYASHGTNIIDTGAGRDVVHAHFGHGEIHCGSNLATVFLSRVSRKRYKLSGCSHISYKTLGY